MDSSSHILTLTGVAIGNDTATITLRTVDCEDDGINIHTSVKLLEYEFQIESFFFGYNLASFLDASKVSDSAKVKRAALNNYDETLTFEFVLCEQRNFLSMFYRSVLPVGPNQSDFDTVSGMSRIASDGKRGSRFSLLFLPILNDFDEVRAWVDGVLHEQPINITNPYPQ